MESIVIPATTESASISIAMHLIDERQPRSGYPISGFPRSIGEGETIKRSRKFLNFMKTYAYS